MDITKVVFTIIMLFSLMIPGYILRKKRMLFGDSSLSGLVNLLLYVCQPILSVRSFALAKDIDPYDTNLLANMGWVFLFALIGQFAVYGLGKLIFKHLPIKPPPVNGVAGASLSTIPPEKLADKKRGIYTYAATFSNSAFIGIPFVEMIAPAEFKAQAVIYATVYVVVFNMLVWTIGVHALTGDIKSIKLHKAIINPAVLGTLVGLLFFYVPQINFFAKVEPFDKFLNLFADMNAPISMVIIGSRFADIRIRDLFTDASLYITAALRLIVAPALLFVILLPFVLTNYFGELRNAWVILVPIVLLGVPPAASMIAMAEKFDADIYTAVKGFLTGTLLSLIALPALLWLLTM
ncbi:MAG: AEC family transporter [Clostridiales bacterium]|jgi:predicted permease|nr:AEC family transporter [Clostridiales bacterium]